MATENEKHQWNQLPEPWRHGGIFRNISNDLTIARVIGFVFDENADNWFIVVDGVKYWAYDTTISYEQWADPYRTLGDKNPYNDEIFVFNATGLSSTKRDGTYVLYLDKELNTFFYFNSLGQKIYDYQPGYDVQSESLKSDIDATPNYNFDENIPDILGNLLKPKNNLKSHLDLLTKTRKQYKRFWSAETQAEKITALEERATDIVAEESKIINLLATAQKAKTTDNTIINTVSLVSSFFGFVGKAAAISVQTAVRFAQSQTTDKRIQLLGEELEYLNAEYEAIKNYFDAQNINPNLTASSGFEKWLVKNWGWIVAAAVSFSAMIYIIRKRRKSK